MVESKVESKKNRPPSPVLFIALFAVACMAILIVGYQYAVNQRADMATNIRSELTTLAQSSAEEIGLHRRQLNAQELFLAGSPSVGEFIRSYRSGTANPKLTAHLRDWMDHFREAEALESISLIDPVSNAPVFVVGRMPVHDVSSFTSSLSTSRNRGESFCVEAGSIAGTDSFTIEAISALQMDTTVPDSQRLLLVLSVNPRNGTNPFIEFWPDLSISGEIIFAFREGDDVVVVPTRDVAAGNHVRTRFSISEKDLLAARGMRGELGLMNGIDYRGADVLGAVTQVPGSGWIVVAKIEQFEITGHQRRDFVMTILMLFIIIVMAGLALLSVWRKRELVLVGRELKNAHTISGLNRILRVTSAVNAAGISSANREQFIRAVCHSAVEDGSYDLCVIGFKSPEKGVYHPAVSEGPSSGFVESIRRAGSAAALDGFDPTRTAVRDGIAVSINDVTAEIPVEAVRNEYLRHNLHAAAVIPLRDAEQVIGGLHLYSARPGCFTTEEMALLSELGSQISSVLQRIEAEANKTAAAAQLAQSESRYRNLVTQMRDGIAQSDFDGRIIFVNDAFCNMTGYTREELLGQTGAKLLALPQTRDTIRVKEHERRQGQSDIYELEIRTKQGTLLWVSVSAAPVLDEAGHVAGSLGILTDITERKLSEEKLRNSEHNFKAIFESSPVAIAVRDLSAIRDRVFALKAKHGQRFLEYLVANPYEVMKLAADIRTIDLNIPFIEMLDADSKKTARDPSFRFLSPKSVPGIAASLDAFAGGATRTHSQLTITTSSGEEKQVLSAIQIAPGYEHTWGRFFLSMVDISERTRMELELRESEARLRLHSAALEAAANAIVITDRDGLITWANPAFTAVTGYTVGEVAGLRPGEFLKSGKQPPEFYAEMWKTILAGNVWHGELVNRKKDGTLYDEEMTITPLRDLNGTIQNYVAIKQDISERLLSISAREEAVNLVKATLESTADGILVINLDGSVASWNTNFVKMWGFSHEVMSTRDRSLMMNSVLDQISNADEFLAAHGYLNSHPEAETFDMLYFKDGRIFERYSRPLLVQNIVRGRVLGFHDATERIRGEEQLRTSVEGLRISEEKYRSLFTESKDAICMTDPAGTFTDGNPAALELFGIASLDLLLQSNLFDRFSKSEDRNKFLERLTLEGYFEGADFELTGPDGARIFANASATVIRNAGGDPAAFRFILRDVTRQRVMQQQLLQAQKMDSLGTLAAGIAHDFNNILTIVLAHSDIVRMFQNEPAKFSQSIDAVQNATLRGAALVRQLLTFARKTEPVMDLLSIAPIVNDILRLLSETFPKTIEVAANIQGGLPMVEADATQIHQVLLNLCVNARDAMPNGGLLSIRLNTESGETVRTQFPQAAQELYLALRVADTGTGMDPETRKRIFEPFFTTKESGKGTGLGLAIVFGVIQSHRAFINVESEPGQGTSFTLYFPVPVGRVELAKLSSPEGEPVATGTETVLIIEDEDPLRQIVQHHLSSQGYTVYAAADGLEGVSVFLRFRDSIKLVITDLGLPKMNGVQVVKKLRMFSPDLKIMVASGYISPADRKDLAAAGVTEILQKPYNAKDLLQRVRKTLDTPAA